MQQLQPVFLVAITSCLVALSWERDDYYEEEEEEDQDAMEPSLPPDLGNGTEVGLYLGSPCEVACSPRLPHVVCNTVSRICECDKKYPVRIGPRAGCGKPLRLGDQCFYERTCSFTDQHASCIQVNHNALCQCKPGYHTVSLQRPTKRVFCSEDLVLLTTDVPTLLGVASGLAVFTALICFVLKLFSRARFARPRHFANANLAPPILFSSETGIPLAVHHHHHHQRPSSRSSSQRSSPTSAGGSVPGGRMSRRPSSAAMLVPASSSRAAGSRRPSNASIHSSASSSRSYSLRRYEREREQKEQRAAAVAAAAAAANALHHPGLRPAQSLPGVALSEIAEGGPSSSGCGMGHTPSPSPKTAMSTDELLPVLDEVREDNLQPLPSTSVASTSIAAVASTSQQHRREASFPSGRRILHGEIGPAIAGPSSSAGVHR
ncbi:uncharacterized protein LOC124172104 [Ischnura elegans]|uniref:uncharacterized protein LOC124172104 n=1 Tax=Ischnura elegans TaxID=197161 RepID=UPI001ED8865C|nr:uncharacterized protein LOC124172104 [Ischnura elegans]